MRYHIPKSWPVRSLKNVAKVITGSTPSTSHPEYYGGQIPFVGPSNLGSSEPIVCSDKYLSQLGAQKSRLLPAESVLVCCIGATIGKVGFAGKELATNQQINALVFDQELIYPRYAFYYCQTLATLIRHKGASTTLPILPKGRFQELQIPLPPVSEQRRIAAILDKADSIRRKRKEAIALTEELLRSAFLDMFGDPVTNPKGWDECKLGEILHEIDSGWSPKCNSESAEHQEWGVLKLGAVTWGYFDENENKAMVEGVKPRPELEVKEGDLLFSRKNTYELVGASTYVYRTRSHLMLPDLLFRLRLNDKVDPVFLWRYLSQEAVRKQLSLLASGSSGSMPNISKGRLKTLNVFLPPIELQKSFRDFVDRALSQKNNAVLESNELNALFSSLLQRAFRGEL